MPLIFLGNKKATLCAVAMRMVTEFDKHSHFNSVIIAITRAGQRRSL